MSRLKSSLPETLAAAVKAAAAEWQAGGKIERLWRRDSALWTGNGEGEWLGWLDIVESQLAHHVELRNLSKEVWSAGFKDAVLLGMGGSSLCPEALRLSFGRIAGYPNFRILDSTDPVQVKSVENEIDIAKTLFIVSSKSGTTLEPNIFKDYFFERTRQVVGPDKAGSHFMAITDPGSRLQEIAEHDRFRHVFPGRAAIGGRYSALSHFGMVPAAVMGIDTRKLLDRAQEMVRACGASVPVEENPGAMLGMILGGAAVRGRDKLTIVTSPDIAGLGAWLEQLLAESTGKSGKGIIPVDREDLGAPEAYGHDRIFVYLHTQHASDVRTEAKIFALERAGHAVVRIAMADAYDLGGEFFRWEMATAVAGAILGVSPFDQPDVEASKVAAHAFIAEYDAEYEKTGSLPAEKPVFADGEVELFADTQNAVALTGAGESSFTACLQAHLDSIGEHDYFAIMAFIPMSEVNRSALQSMRQAVRDSKGVATCLEFGPRFLHSTGQAYKGGPNSGVFLQVTCDDPVNVPVPGRKYTFGLVKAAQARGDFAVMAGRGRRLLRIHLGRDLSNGLSALRDALAAALEAGADVTPAR